MQRALILIPLLLAACATPREQCISNVSRELRVVNGLVAETQGNIARGYAVDTRQDVVPVNTTCRIANPDGSFSRVQCQEVEVRNRRVPVAIDLNAETAKLNSLLNRQAQMQSRVNADVQQCVAVHPE